jgi:hypothetical protein
MIDEVVAAVNAHLAETKITTGAASADGKEYRFGDRALRVHFFRPDELYSDPVVPARMNALKKRFAVHGGYIEIKEQRQDREGWNIILVRPPESIYGEWRIVETRVSALSRRVAAFEPFATEAQLLADNLSCHWSTTMHTFNLTDKVLEEADILRILEVFIPKG